MHSPAVCICGVPGPFKEHSFTCPAYVGTKPAASDDPTFWNRKAEEASSPTPTPARPAATLLRCQNCGAIEEEKGLVMRGAPHACPPSGGVFRHIAVKLDTPANAPTRAEGEGSAYVTAEAPR